MLDRPTTDAVHRLHKGLGVRDDRLFLLLRNTKLGSLWRVDVRAPEVVARTIVIYRLDRILRDLDQHKRLVGRAIYNLDHDIEMHVLDLDGRQQLLRERNPGAPRFSRRTVSRVIWSLQERVTGSLSRSNAPIPDETLRELTQREAAFADRVAGLVGPAAFDRLVRGSYAAPIDQAAKAFLHLPVLAPKSRTGELIIARTTAHGDWLCVFSTEPALREHQSATRPQPWSGAWQTMPGADLVRTVVHRWPSLGIVVNPPTKRSADATGTLRLPPRMLAAIAEHLPG